MKNTQRATFQGTAAQKHKAARPPLKRKTWEGAVKAGAELEPLVLPTRVRCERCGRSILPRADGFTLCRNFRQCQRRGKKIRAAQRQGAATRAFFRELEAHE